MGKGGEGETLIQRRSHMQERRTFVCIQRMPKSGQGTEAGEEARRCLSCLCLHIVPAEWEVLQESQKPACLLQSLCPPEEVRYKPKVLRSVRTLCEALLKLEKLFGRGRHPFLVLGSYSSWIHDVPLSWKSNGACASEMLEAQERISDAACSDQRSLKSMQV